MSEREVRDNGRRGKDERETERIGEEAQVRRRRRRRRRRREGCGGGEKQWQ